MRVCTGRRGQPCRPLVPWSSSPATALLASHRSAYRLAIAKPRSGQPKQCRPGGLSVSAVNHDSSTVNEKGIVVGLAPLTSHTILAPPLLAPCSAITTSLQCRRLTSRIRRHSTRSYAPTGERSPCGCSVPGQSARQEQQHNQCCASGCLSQRTLHTLGSMTHPRMAPAEPSRSPAAPVSLSPWRLRRQRRRETLTHTLTLVQARRLRRLGLRTLAIFSQADRLQPHRYKADESYLVGAPEMTPVQAYLDVEARVGQGYGKGQV